MPQQVQRQNIGPFKKYSKRRKSRFFGARRLVRVPHVLERSAHWYVRNHKDRDRRAKKPAHRLASQVSTRNAPDDAPCSRRSDRQRTSFQRWIMEASMKVSEAMTRRVRVANPKETVQHAAQIMASLDV